MGRPLLHDYFRSSASYRVRIALNLKGVGHDAHPVSLVDGGQKSEAYRALNPQGFVPMLEIDGFKLTQSLAIFDYLDAKTPDPPFVPKDPPGRAHVLALALTIACDIHPLNNLRVLQYLKGTLGAEQDAVDAWYRHWVTEGLDALEQLAAPQAGDFLHGDQLSMADICLVPQLYNARRFAVPLDSYPTLTRADANACRLQAFIDAHPDRHAPEETAP